MSHDHADVDSLAERLAIAPSFEDAFGNVKHVSAETLRQLASALQGKSTISPAASEAEPRWPPVWVALRGADGRVELDVTPWTAAGTQVSFRVELEAGGHTQGQGSVTPRLSLGEVALGYHQLQLRLEAEAEVEASSLEVPLIVVPQHAYLPDAWRAGGKSWALTLQLYSLRSERNWGIGDFTDLACVAELAARHGVDAIGLNPLHALFPEHPERVSPYSPSSRTFLHPIYIDVEAVPELASSRAAQEALRDPAFAATLARLRSTPQVDYAGVWSSKTRILTVLCKHFAQQHLGRNTERGAAFASFLDGAGEGLRHFAAHQVLRSQQAESATPSPDQQEALRDPSSAAARAFETQHAEQLLLVRYLQFEADRQLAEAARRARAAGMKLGLYRDVAVGVSADGAEAWGDPGMLVSEVSIGAPPDVFNPQGQDWGLTPQNPLALRERAYQPFIQTIRANMRHAGVMRLDHVLGLKRLWWIPRGNGAAAGAYVNYPLDDLLGIIALESVRNRCVVVGEDLGTVPAGFRDQMQSRAILSYRLLMFERSDGDADGEFIAPQDYPELAAVAVSTHDLPTLKGFWTGEDLTVRQALGLFPSEQSARDAVKQRDSARERLLVALAREQLLTQPGGEQARFDELALAAHRYLALSPSKLLLVQAEDLLGQLEQMNVPGTVDQHPNWRRKLAASVANLFQAPLAARLSSMLSQLRR